MPTIHAAAAAAGGIPTIAAALILAALYAAVCLAWPYASCRRCAGSGKRRAPSGKAWRRCSRCGGSGERHRLGARLLGR